MNEKQLSRFFIEKCIELKTFDITAWVNEDGYPKRYEENRIFNTAKIPQGTVSQSLYMSAGQSVHMGLFDCDPGIGNDDIELDLIFWYDSNKIMLNYNNITAQESYIDMDDDEVGLDFDFGSITILLSSIEEMHFQESLVQEKYFTFEEEQMMMDFFTEIRTRFFENKVPIR